MENNLILKMKCKIIGEQNGVHFMVFSVCGRRVDVTWHTVTKHRVVEGIDYLMDVEEFRRLLKGLDNSLKNSIKPFNKFEALKSILWFPFDSFMSFTIPYKKIGKYKAKCSGADWSGLASYLVWSKRETVIMIKDWYGGFGWGGVGGGSLIAIESFEREMQKFNEIEGGGLPPVP